MSDHPTEYRVDLDTYSGPLDLLLYLIRSEEVDIYNIPISKITGQYLRYVEMMNELNINVAGEFIVMAATLIEIKSRMMAPEPEPMPEEEDSTDPRLELVRQLMEYRKFKEAAMALTECAQGQLKRFARPGEHPVNVPQADTTAPTGVSLWVLLDAFSRVLQQIGAHGTYAVQLSDIPQEVLQQRLEEKVRLGARISFFSAFEGEASRPLVIGMFLALLELTRLQVIRLEQEQAFGEIWLNYVPPDQREAVAAAQMEPERKKDPSSEVQSEHTAAPTETAAADDNEYDEWSPDTEEFDLPDVPDVEMPESPLPKPPAEPSTKQGTDTATNTPPTSNLGR